MNDFKPVFSDFSSHYSTDFSADFSADLSNKSAGSISDDTLTPIEKALEITIDTPPIPDNNDSDTVTTSDTSTQPHTIPAPTSEFPLSFEDVIETLSSKVYRRGIHYDLDHLKKAVHQLGYPNEDLPKTIHVAGTNGKGSTVGFLAEGLIAAGFRVGTYTSPHISCYSERIAINGVSISHQDFIAAFLKVAALEDYDRYTEFEVLTLMSFVYFKEQLPDFVIYETGLGGRLDATNLVEPILTIITKIDKDHESILGSSLESIAMEKAGIIKPHVPLITLFHQDPDVSTVLSNTSEERHSPYIEVTNTFPPYLDFESYPHFQRPNFSLAGKALSYLVQPDKLETATRGMAHYKPWGKYTKIAKNDQTIIIDSAHNVAGIFALLEAIQTDFPFAPLSFLVGIQKTKDYNGMVNAITSVAKQLYVCEFEPETTAAVNDVYEHVHRQSRLTAYDASLIPQLPDHPILVITGSIHFVSRFKEGLSD